MSKQGTLKISKRRKRAIVKGGCLAGRSQKRASKNKKKRLRKQKKKKKKKNSSRVREISGGDLCPQEWGKSTKRA